MKKLVELQKMLKENYRQYRSEKITKQEYLVNIKPIDQEISELEMSTLQDIPALRESSLLHFQTQELQEGSVCKPVSLHCHR